MRRLILAAVLASSTVALAQQQRSSPAPQKEITYEDGDIVSGGVEGPATTLVPAPPDRTPHSSLIQIRDSFKDEVLNSAADLQ